MDFSFVTVVSGLPRSGTSMMMAMLARGGMDILTDRARASDPDNPGGYFEYEPVKRTEEDPSWVAGARGKAVKVIYRFVKHLPDTFEYRIIMMRRQIEEILSSQRKMLQRRGKKGAALSDAQLAQAFLRKMEDLESWIDRQPNMIRLDATYHRILADPDAFCHDINAFLDNRLDTEFMVDAVDPGLYRNRMQQEATRSGKS